MKSAELRAEDWINSRYKRSLDIVIAAGSLPIWAPIGAAALSLSRIIDGKDTIFRHQRYGQNSELFTLAKIRTLKDIDPDVTNHGVSDEHATAFGRILRLRGLDEIPQVINVLSGDMSLVGPRAVSPSGINRMQEILTRNEFDEWLEAYSLSKPGGISSYGLHYRQSDMGLRNYNERAAMDVADFRGASLSNDLKMISKAIGVGTKLFLRSTPQLEEPELGYETGNT